MSKPDRKHIRSSLMRVDTHLAGSIRELKEVSEQLKKDGFKELSTWAEYSLQTLNKEKAYIDSLRDAHERLVDDCFSVPDTRKGG